MILKTEIQLVEIYLDFARLNAYKKIASGIERPPNGSSSPVLDIALFPHSAVGYNGNKLHSLERHTTTREKKCTHDSRGFYGNSLN